MQLRYDNLWQDPLVHSHLQVPQIGRRHAMGSLVSAHSRARSPCRLHRPIRLGSRQESKKRHIRCALTQRDTTTLNGTVSTPKQTLLQQLRSAASAS